MEALTDNAGWVALVALVMAFIALVVALSASRRTVPPASAARTGPATPGLWGRGTDPYVARTGPGIRGASGDVVPSGAEGRRAEVGERSVGGTGPAGAAVPDPASASLAALAARLGALEEVGRRSIQNVGLVRFNPFDDTGSNQSFALALLDADGNGLILSSLHSRQATRVYVKGVVHGRCEAGVSAEEAAALRQAGIAI